MSKVTSKLQVTLPKSMAEKLHIGPGDQITWEIAGDVLRVAPAAKRKKSQNALDDQLRWFDQATRRQRQRERKRTRLSGRPKPSADRGWRREDLYHRGFKA
ncbi:MAG: AbrB/MazE/SpoVT family DNA-binding domain-containing protein [Candidatus Binatia bacterium]